VQRGEAEYDLFLRADLHTTGFTQWFYFAVTATHPQHLADMAYNKKTQRVVSRSVTRLSATWSSSRGLYGPR
jgi:hypothetical protein